MAIGKVLTEVPPTGLEVWTDASSASADWTCRSCHAAGKSALIPLLLAAKLAIHLDFEVNLKCYLGHSG